MLVINVQLVHFSNRVIVIISLESFFPSFILSFAALLNCTPVDRASDSMMAPT